MRKAEIVFLSLLLAFAGLSPAEELSALRKDIQAFKSDPRGPYQAVRWFCPDGSVIPPQDRCSEPGGIQHALPKSRVKEIAETHHLHLGQILAGTEFEDFFDRDSRNARMKQYQMEKFLQASDDGWILRRARYYRGAVQAEDEDAWGKQFLTWLASRDDFLKEQFFLMRQMAKDIPHSDNVDRATRIRALARKIAAAVPEFMDIRIKIHGKPDATDVEEVQKFLGENEAELTRELRGQLYALVGELEARYRKANARSLEHYLEVFPAQTPLGYQLRKTLNTASIELADTHAHHFVEQSDELSHLLWLVRRTIHEVSRDQRLALIDLSIEAEALLFRTVGLWQPRTLRELLQKNYLLAKAAVGCGFIELWEWDHLEPSLLPKPANADVTSEEILESVQVAHRGVAWGAGMVEAIYRPVVERFSQFEPLSRGFIDDRIRSSILLRFGEAADRLFDVSTRFSGLSHQVIGVKNPGQIRGLNPGVALGELVVLPTAPEDAELSPEKIYVLLRAPDNLKPVAGIATVSEGNAVSHVQLLARNSGIPNASLSRGNLHDLLPYSGTKVFYAVSPRGTVVMKPVSEMTTEEVALVDSTRALESKITVPVGRVDLEQQDFLNLSALRASDSGAVCGPKAANLGQLSTLFSDKVPPGLVIPFGVFHRHLEQTMPGSSSTYWEAIGELLPAARKVEQPQLLTRLEEIRDSIRNMAFLPGFAEKLKSRFHEVLQQPLGELRVFVRSDTNMEDLEDFTGAGLNLTVANIQKEEEIFQAIRDVWASPFSERSYRWRQHVLTNPDAVYPSVLLIPSVNVEKSGVLITSGVSSGDPDDLTVAFNWGGAGAVGGQSAETYLLRADGRDVLLSPSREPEFNALPEQGGIEAMTVAFTRPVLSRSERLWIRRLAAELRERLPGSSGIDFEGPFDVELGFWGGRPWLFQVRPFVENDEARSSSYLGALDPRLPQTRVSLEEPLL